MSRLTSERAFTPPKLSETSSIRMTTSLTFPAWLFSTAKTVIPPQNESRPTNRTRTPAMPTPKFLRHTLPDGKQLV